MNRGLPRLRCTAAGQTRCRRFGPDLLDMPRPARRERILEAVFLGIIIPSSPKSAKFTTLVATGTFCGGAAFPCAANGGSWVPIPFATATG